MSAVTGSFLLLLLCYLGSVPAAEPAPLGDKLGEYYMLPVDFQEHLKNITPQCKHDSDCDGDQMCCLIFCSRGCMVLVEILPEIDISLINGVPDVT
ncbi:WAP four-disulfide core domain protein 12-like [Pseudophryne corroboree]|uniref:WAP four-disulfide core domain protein 12-like n=1 Tax=Pseudophryne corroboree TaxID=495146 RepID=UPI0030821308